MIGDGGKLTCNWSFQFLREWIESIEDYAMFMKRVLKFYGVANYKKKRNWIRVRQRVE